MVKIEAFDDSHFMHQAVRVCQTDHTDSIIACIACSFDLKNKLLETHQNCTLTVGYSLGMVKTEAF